MRVVVDTNVLVSGLLNPRGPPGQVVDLITTRVLAVLYDDRIVAEYREVLARPKFGFNAAEVEALLAAITGFGEIIVPRRLGLPKDASVRVLTPSQFVSSLRA